MNNTTQKRILNKLKTFVKRELGTETLDDMQFLTGSEGKQYSEYASDSAAYVSFEGAVYDLLNFPDSDNFSFMNKLHEFMDKNGVWYEQGNAWNFNIYAS